MQPTSTLPVQKRIAVICKDDVAFQNFMSQFQISMFSRKNKKFWTNKGSVEYFMLVNNTLPEITNVIMLDGCQDKFDLYLTANSKCIVGELTEGEKQKHLQLVDVINTMPEEATHGQE
jgi:hypothetical protein